MLLCQHFRHIPFYGQGYYEPIGWYPHLVSAQVRILKGMEVRQAYICVCACVMHDHEGSFLRAIQQFENENWNRLKITLHHHPEHSNENESLQHCFHVCAYTVHAGP